MHHRVQRTFILEAGILLLTCKLLIFRDNKPECGLRLMKNTIAPDIFSASDKERLWCFMEWDCASLNGSFMWWNWLFGINCEIQMLTFDFCCCIPMMENIEWCLPQETVMNWWTAAGFSYLFTNIAANSSREQQLTIVETIFTRHF